MYTFLFSSSLALVYSVTATAVMTSVAVFHLDLTYCLRKIYVVCILAPDELIFIAAMSVLAEKLLHVCWCKGKLYWVFQW